MSEKDFLRVGKYFCRHWRYFERNISIFKYTEKTSAIAFFKVLKELNENELRLLAERYYKSEVEYNFSKAKADYQTVKPVDYKTIAKKLGFTQTYVIEELKRCESKVGEHYYKLKAVAERELAVENVEKVRQLTLDPFTDEFEIEVLNKAFNEISVYRTHKESEANDHALVLENRRLRGLGI